MDTRQLEIIQLKARAYDLIAVKEQAHNELAAVNERLRQVLSEPQVAVEESLVLP